MATTIEGDAIYIGNTEYVDVSIGGVTIPSTRYTNVTIPVPTGYMPYSWIWKDNVWDETLVISIQHRVAASTPRDVLCIYGPSGRTISANNKIRVFIRKFAES